MNRRPSRQTVAVLRALANDPIPWRYGYELGQEVGLKAGTLYPILIRLCDRGLLESSWETEAPPGRPPRHLYRLTGPGIQLAAELAAQAVADAEAAAAAPITPAEAPGTARPARAPQGRKLPRNAW